MRGGKEERGTARGSTMLFLTRNNFEEPTRNNLITSYSVSSAMLDDADAISVSILSLNI
jgi:hypothetical protein